MVVRPFPADAPLIAWRASLPRIPRLAAREPQVRTGGEWKKEGGAPSAPPSDFSPAFCVLELATDRRVRVSGRCRAVLADHAGLVGEVVVGAPGPRRTRVSVENVLVDPAAVIRRTGRAGEFVCPLWAYLAARS